MRKFFSVLLTFVMVLGLCACNVEDSPSTPEEREKVGMITDGTPFSDGVAIVAHRSEHSDIRFSVIDKEGYILGDFDFQDYNLFHQGMYCYVNGVLVYGNKVYDKTGTLIASPEKSGYTQLITDARCDSKLLAVKVEETASGNKYYFGILDNKGGWIEPLSDTHPIAQLLTETITDSFYLNWNAFPTDDVVMVAENCYYNMKTGAVTNAVEEIYGTSENVYNDNHDYLYTHHEVFKKDIDGNVTKIKDGVYLTHTLPTGFIGGFSRNDDHYINLYYFDENGNEIINLHTEAIDSVAVIDGYLFVVCDQNLNNYHTCIYKTTGETVVESIAEDGHLNDLRVWTEYGLFGFDERDIYNFEGEKIEFADYAISGFGEGLFYVVSKKDYHRAYLDINGNKVL